MVGESRNPTTTQKLTDRHETARTSENPTDRAAAAVHVDPSKRAVTHGDPDDGPLWPTTAQNEPVTQEIAAKLAKPGNGAGRVQVVPSPIDVVAAVEIETHVVWLMHATSAL